MDSATRKFNATAERATDYHNSTLATRESFGLDALRKYEIVPSEGVMYFLDDADRRMVAARYQVIGRLDLHTHKWLWSWGDDSVPSAQKIPRDALRTFGKKVKMSGFYTYGTVEDFTEEDALRCLIFASYFMKAHATHGIRDQDAQKTHYYALFDLRRV